MALGRHAAATDNTPRINDHSNGYDDRDHARSWSDGRRRGRLSGPESREAAFADDDCVYDVRIRAVHVDGACAGTIYFPDVRAVYVNDQRTSCKENPN